jgi:hypothetical protein
MRSFVIAAAAALAFAPAADAVTNNDCCVGRQGVASLHCGAGQYVCDNRCISRAQICHQPRPPRACGEGEKRCGAVCVASTKACHT